MMLGDPAAWTEKFVSLDVRLLQRIEAIWPQCLTVLPDQPGEDTITINLVNVLSKDQEARKLFHWLEYQAAYSMLLPINCINCLPVKSFIALSSGLGFSAARASEPLPVGETGVSNGKGGGREGDHPFCTERSAGRTGRRGRSRAGRAGILPRARGGAP